MSRSPFAHFTLFALAACSLAAPCAAATVTLALDGVGAALATQMPGQAAEFTKSGGASTASAMTSSDAPNLSWLATGLATSSGVLQSGVSTGMWATGDDGQGSLTSWVYGVSTFTATTPGTEVSLRYLLSGAFLQVDGDHGGTSGPLVNPIDNASANTVGAEFTYRITVSAAGLTQTIVDASARVFGHGQYVVGNAPDAVTIPRNYQLELTGGASGTMLDSGCFEGNCWGKDVFIDAISGVGVFYPEPDIEYAIQVDLFTKIALKAYENQALAVSDDPNGLNFLSITMTTPEAGTSAVPTPGSASLVLAGLSAWGLTRRRSAAPGAARCSGRA